MDIRVGHYPEMSELRVELFGHELLIGQSHDAPTCVVTQHALAGHHNDDDEEEDYGNNEDYEDYDENKDSY